MGDKSFGGEADVHSLESSSQKTNICVHSAAKLSLELSLLSKVGKSFVKVSPSCLLLLL